jgi:hypothetical protein
MKYPKLFAVLALLFSFPIFSNQTGGCPLSADNPKYTITCGSCDPCTFTCNLNEGCCDAGVGNCDCVNMICTEISDSNWECVTSCKESCYCNELPPVGGNVTAKQSALLVYSSFNASQISSLQTGLMGTTEGTYADKELVFIKDSENPHTNEIEIRPAWCK